MCTVGGGGVEREGEIGKGEGETYFFPFSLQTLQGWPHLDFNPDWQCILYDLRSFKGTSVSYR